MKKRISTIVRCADLLRHVYTTVASVERQIGGAGDIVLVTDPSTPVAAADWLREFAARRGLVIAHAATARPGAIRNVGMRATDSPYVVCVDAGDRLDPRFHETAIAKFEGDPDVDLVTCSIHVFGPGARTQVVARAAPDLEALVGDAGAIHSAAAFRRTAWASLGGFDETLPSLEQYEFALRVLHAGRRIAAIDAPLLLRVVDEGLLYRRAWERACHVEAVERIVAKHATLFRRDPAEALYARERRLRDVGEEYRRLTARRAAALQELEGLKTRAGDLRRSLGDEDAGIDLGELRRTTPLSRDWGFDRGLPIDRFYIERFLETHAADVTGLVLELQGPEYAERFGGARLTRCDVVDLDPSNSRATIVSDLRSAGNIASDAYDCVILTQTLHLVDDLRTVLAECARVLRPGGVLLATLPAASRVSLEYGQDGDFWRVTEAGARKVFSEIFPSDALDVRAHGNVLVNAAFLYGLACHELTDADFAAVDPYFPLLVTVRAQKPLAGRNSGRVHARHFAARTVGRAAILLYHRVGKPPSDVHGLAVAAEAFRAQMEHLRRSYHPVPLGELAAAAREDRLVPGSVAVTFDDGYVDNDTHASPILCELRVPATFFVTTDRLGEHYEFWWDVLEDILLSSSVPSELRIDLPEGARRFATATAEERQAAHAAVYHAIVGSPAPVRDATIRALTVWSGRKGPSDAAHRRMNRDEIRALASREGHSIGAHTVNHLMLPRQPIEIQLDEIDRSRRELEALLATNVRALAYPFGAFSEETVHAAADSSIELAVTCEAKLLGSDVDLLRLPRLEVTSRSVPHFADWLQAQFAVTSPSKSH